MSVWNPRVNPYESTSSQIWVTDGGGETIESIEAGWMATAEKPFPSFFAYWTDLRSNDWWLNIQGYDIGYWPADLFAKLKTSAQLLQWGGRVVDRKPQGIHTSTEMGSGHFPREGQGRAAWFHSLEYADAFGNFNHATDLEGHATRPECYGVKVEDWDKDLVLGFGVNSTVNGAQSKLDPKSVLKTIVVDGYGGSGCYNLDCPGFVQTNTDYGIDSRVDPISIYGGKQYFINVKISKDFKTGNWWLNMEGTDIGYWPVELFTYLKTSAQVLEWGGRVVNTNPKGFHTTTPMGSGHFPVEGLGHAAWFHNLEYVDENGSFSRVGDGLSGRATRPECYDVKVEMLDKEYGANFFYGGPGYSHSCLFPR
ncbi:hypothetical protein LINGRAHAP2_LOCUS12289 [Linum grandiflorum]